MEFIGIYSLLGASIVLQSINLIKTKYQITKHTSGAIVVDTCALIDGRVRDLAEAGFVTQKMYIPRPVLDELQYLADHGDAHKRSRARFGLDVVKSLQEIEGLKVSLPAVVRHKNEEVDELLIRYAEKIGASLYTTDYNLNKVARIRGVTVLNVNELAHALRPVRLPGEVVTVKVLQKGELANQGVGYLEDGTMVVIDGASSQIGKDLAVSIERMIQTEAGKMVFASLQKSQHTNRSSQLSPQTRIGDRSNKQKATNRPARSRRKPVVSHQ